jgi:ubiquinone/menaquinone biosynthesis C-methylase UbiE
MSETVDLRRMHEQCAFEQRVARRLLDAESREARLPIYGQIAIEYAARFPEHLPTADAKRQRTAEYESAFVTPMLRPDTIMAEIGPGRCHLAFRLARHVKKIYGIDVARAYLGDDTPDNFEFLLTDGIRMPLPDYSLDLVVSNQLMEHLHPDDALDQLREIHRVLKIGGVYACVTPNRVNGPHDCSAYFPDLPCPMSGRNYIAAGLHFKEYTSREMIDIFKQAGFRSVRPFIGARGRYLRVPRQLPALVETAVQALPADWRKRSKLLGMIISNRVIAVK